MKQNNIKKLLIGWTLLILLIILSIILSYLKYTNIKNNKYIEETPVENSTEEAINKALSEIETNFNENSQIQELEEQGIKVHATLKNHSLYINYETDTIKTYELNYRNLYLTIKIENKEDNINKFEKVFPILIYAIQKRINNEENIDEIISNILEGKKEYKGISKITETETITYKINITEKLKI